jgi:hypothetical protein
MHGLHVRLLEISLKSEFNSPLFISLARIGGTSVSFSRTEPRGSVIPLNLSFAGETGSGAAA